jgi:gluconate 2-dehydrogenase gamma chain
MEKSITRRVFIASTVLAGTALILLPQKAKTKIDIEPFKVIEHVQEVLFPPHAKAPSAREFGATNYLARVSLHSSFVPSDLSFLNRGAYELIKYKSDFLTIDFTTQQDIIDKFSKTTIGRNWISLLLFYTLEALLSDPIYGGNRDELGWRWLSHNAGQPRPQALFGEIDEKV